MQRAFVVSTITGILCAVIGVYVVLRGMAFIGAGIAHASFGGVALGLLININPFFTAIVFCIVTAWGIGLISEKKRVKEDTAVGIFFASTMALGVLLIGFLKGYNMVVFGYIFGNILAVSSFDVWTSISLAFIVIFIILFYFKEFLFITFDIEMATVTGLPVRALNFLMLTLIALTIVISIKSVGIVLVSALIVTPAAAAYQLTDNFKSMMLFSILIGIFSSWTGLLFSALFNIASGATIVLTATVFFFMCFFCSPQRRKLLKRMKNQRNMISN